MRAMSISRKPSAAARSKPLSSIKRKPAATRAKTKPAIKAPVTKPLVAKPTVAKPPVTKFTVTEPTVAKTTVAKPPVTKPTVAKPTVAKPTVTKSMNNKKLAILRKIFQKPSPARSLSSASSSSSEEKKVARSPPPRKLSIDSDDGEKAKVLLKVFQKKKSPKSAEPKSTTESASPTHSWSLKDHPSWDILFNMTEVESRPPATSQSPAKLEKQPTAQTMTTDVDLWHSLEEGVDMMLENKPESLGRSEEPPKTPTLTLAAELWQPTEFENMLEKFESPAKPQTRPIAENPRRHPNIRLGK